MNRRLRYPALILLGILSNATSALAQTAPADAPPAAAEPAPAPAPAPLAPTAAAEAAPPPVTDAGIPVVNPLKIEPSKGTYIKLGLLLQPQYQATSNAELASYAQNLFLRRTRILVGGSILNTVDYFVDTDYPNLFLSANEAGAAGAPNRSVKATPGMNIQDAFATFKPVGDVFKIDAGYMLPPMSHNAVQGAGTLYGWDYFGYTFQHSSAGYGGSANAFNSSANPVGRDLGMELRGLVLGGHLEYRAGLFQGLRNAQTATDLGARNFFRVTARVQVNLLDAEPGFFYAGTYLGTKKIVSLGASYDFQNNYKYFAFDGFVDLPAGPGVLTAQANVAHWNGDNFIQTLVSQTAIMGEAGYEINAAHLSPIVRIEHLVGSGTLQNQSRYAGGLAFWPYGHNSNLKAFYTRIQTTDAPRGVNQINLQWQVYLF